MSSKVQELLEQEPQFVRDTPLDKKFSELAVLLKRIKSDDFSTSLEQDMGLPIGSLLKELLTMFAELCTLARDKESQLPESQRGLIPISLHDMKYFDTLVNLIVVHGIYAHLPNGIGVPLEQRRLDNFKQADKKFRYTRQTHFQLLKYVVEVFNGIMLEKSTLRDILLKGSGFTDVMTALVVLVAEDAKYLDLYNAYEQIQESYELFSMYTVLVQTTSEPRYKVFLLDRLSLLPIKRDDGVLSLIDFIVGIREEEEVSVEKFNHVNQILIAKPKSLTSMQYLGPLFKQIWNGLVMLNRPVIISCLNNLVTEFYYKNKRIVTDFLFKPIWKTILNDENLPVDAKTLNDTMNVMISLSKNNSGDLMNELCQPLYLSLWMFALFLKKNKQDYYKIVLNIIKSFMTVTCDFKQLNLLILNLINYKHENWEYALNLENRLPYIRTTDALEADTTSVFEDMDTGVELLSELLKLLQDEEIVKDVFISVLNRWIRSSNGQEDQLGESSTLLMLCDLKILQKLNETFKNDLIKKPHDILLVIKNLLSMPKEAHVKEEEPDSDDEDEEEENLSSSFSMVLELFSAIISTTEKSELLKSTNLLEDISQQLQGYPNDKQCCTLVSRVQELLSGNEAAPDTTQDLDKQILSKAIVNINDPLVPIRAHGLYELRQLIINKSPVIDTKFVMELHINQLHDPEPFIYLNVIKGLIQLLEVDQSALNFLLDFYQEDESKNLDDVLKIGEVLLNYVQQANELFTGPPATRLVQICLEKIRSHDKDNRLRMSSMSILGYCLRTNSYGITGYVSDLLDCALHILQLETKKEDSKLLRRASLHLIHDLLYSSGFELIPAEMGKQLQTVLKYTKANDDDLLVVEQATQIITLIDDFVKETFRQPDTPDQFQKLKI